MQSEEYADAEQQHHNKIEKIQATNPSRWKPKVICGIQQIQKKQKHKKTTTSETKQSEWCAAERA